MLARFQEKDGGFYMMRVQGKTILTPWADRATACSDNAIASGSSVALHLLQRLWLRSGPPRL